MGIAPHIARLRAFVGHEQLLLPCATVLPLDERGRVLLAWAAGHSDGWGTVGGAVDPGESPAQAAIREAREEIGVEIRLTRLVDVLGGADYEVTYPNGDRAAYVTAVYEASVVDGVPAPADGELSDVAWFTREELPTIPLSRFTRALLTATGYLPTSQRPRSLALARDTTPAPAKPARGGVGGRPPTAKDENRKGKGTVGTRTG